ncbi:hypothetical protein Marpi_0391 [Marinitoga piezophila KA3]|uniref:MetS family NSS transporter small subunit n=1 Tax=Marinitoga piezophila (strain DSM 14283 / JCM 11233 / KA3) TaxID=443254 RepID=H2J4I0_MARPK|nr:MULTISPECIES: MetS family NSS transporter small subunit [Marinitoga]AEX84835.1 hypothetical protein Marpi_0391 [Marinitoga piezophila KA3]
MSGSAIAFMIFAGVVLFGGLAWSLNIAAKHNK